MSNPSPLRFGIVGMGGIGVHHARYLAGLPGAVLAAYSSRDAGRRAAAAGMFPQARAFETHSALIQSKTCDALLIATPHYQHVEIILEAFAAGLHVLVEKPLAVSVSEARRAAAAAARHPHLLFGIMLNQRASPLYQAIRRLVGAGGLGALTRISWIATHWFRPFCYYTVSPWRATWSGEGGGVLINQCHHNLDLLCWITGLMPARITAVGFLGKHHPIETEDEVSAILEYPGAAGEPGPIAHFFASTGEAAGTNRLEIAGTRGRLIAENEVLTLLKTEVDAREYMRTSVEPFSAPPVTPEVLAIPPGPVPEHRGIAENFIATWQAGGRSHDLLAPAASDLPAMELSNAMLQAAVTRQAVDLPLDPKGFDAFLQRQVQQARSQG